MFRRFLTSILLLAAAAEAQVIGSTNTLEHVSYFTRMWSLTDPFAFQAVSNLQTAATAPATNFVRLTNGSSTNQALIGAKPNVLNFDTAYSGAGSLTNGQAAWDPDNHTLSVGLENGVVLQLGQELPIPVENRTGAVITNGMVVGFAGTVAASGRILVSPFMADGAIPSHYFLGMVTSDDGSRGIANMGTGYVTWFGKVRGRDTTGAFDGEYWPSNGVPVYVSTNRPGFLTINKPQAPDPVIIVGSIAYRAVNTGTINVRPRWHCSIRDLDDIDGTVPTTTGQILVYDATRRVHDFTHNINSYATTQALFTVSNLVASLVSSGLTNGAALATAAQGTRADAAYAAVTGSLYGLTYAWVSNSLAALSSSTSTAFNASNIAVSANAAATNAAAVAASAYAEAVEASGAAAAAYSLASMYYDSVTGAVGRSTAAFIAATNAQALATLALGQNAFPEILWSDLPSYDLTWIPEYSFLRIDDDYSVPSGTTATAAVYTVSWATNVHWYARGLPFATNAVPASTNGIVVFGYQSGNYEISSSGFPFPLQPVSGASDFWDVPAYVQPGGITNFYRITAATNVTGGVSLYWSSTNVYSGYLYGTNIATLADFTNATSFVLPPLVDSITSSVVLTHIRTAPVTSRVDLATGPEFRFLKDEWETFYTTEWAPHNAAEGTTPATVTNIAAYVSGLSTQGLASVASLYTLMATSKIDRVWAGETIWYTFVSNTIVEHTVSAYTNLSFSSDFDWDGHYTLYPNSYVLPLTNGWVLTTGTYNGQDGWILQSPTYDATWLSAGFSVPATLTWSAYPAKGDCYVDISFGTNSTVYVFPTNTPVYTETWSYADHTNWMENAGQSWALGIANDAANSAINGHVGLGAAAHPVYAPTTGASLTNTTFAGTVDATAATYVRVPTPVNGQDAANADWVRGLLAIGDPYYATTNRANVAFVTNAVVWSSNAIPAQGSVTVNVASNNHYVFAVVSPTPITGTMLGPANIGGWFYLPTGVPAANYAMSVRAELYYTYNTNSPTLTLGDWEGATQALTPGVTNHLTWALPFPNTAVTGAWVVAALKVISKGSAANSLTLLVGTNTASYTQLRIPYDSSIGARGATNLAFSASATNASYSESLRTFTLPRYPLPGCYDLGTGSTIVIDGSYAWYRCAPVNPYTVTVAVDVARGYTYGLRAYSTCAATYAANIVTQSQWTAAGTNTALFFPGDTNLWYMRGDGR